MSALLCTKQAPFDTTLPTTLAQLEAGRIRDRALDMADGRGVKNDDAKNCHSTRSPCEQKRALEWIIGESQNHNIIVVIKPTESAII